LKLIFVEKIVLTGFKQKIVPFFSFLEQKNVNLYRGPERKTCLNKKNRAGKKEECKKLLEGGERSILEIVILFNDSEDSEKSKASKN